MTTRWREPSNPSEAIAKAWLDNRDREALEMASALLDEGKSDQIDGVMLIVDEEGGPQAFEELAESWVILAESNGDGCLVVFPFETGRVPDTATLRLSLKSSLDGINLVLHPKALEPESMLELPPYMLRSVLTSLLGVGKATGMPWRVHDGHGPGVFVGALSCTLEEAEAHLDEWLKTKGLAMGCGLPCSPSGMQMVLDTLEARRKARLRALEELEDFLRVAAEECGSAVTPVRTVRGGTVWIAAVDAHGTVIDERAFGELPDPTAGTSTSADEALQVGRRAAHRGGLRVIRGDQN